MLFFQCHHSLILSQTVVPSSSLLYIKSHSFSLQATPRLLLVQHSTAQHSTTARVNKDHQLVTSSSSSSFLLVLNAAAAKVNGRRDERVKYSFLFFFSSTFFSLDPRPPAVTMTNTTTTTTVFTAAGMV